MEGNRFGNRVELEMEITTTTQLLGKKAFISVVHTSKSVLLHSIDSHLNNQSLDLKNRLSFTLWCYRKSQK